MRLLSGDYQTLKIERESPFGYFLSNGEEDVLLHYAETNNQKLTIGESIEVFLYNDHKGRIAATLKKPIIVLGEIGFLTVVDYQPKMGFFLDNGIDKQILLPLADLPEEKKIWPEENSKLLVKLTRDKQERLLATLVKEEYEIQDFVAEQQEKSGIINISKKQFIGGIVINHLSVGTKIYMENNQIGFLHHDEQLKELHLGEEIKVRVSHFREDGKINLSMKPLKEESRIEDSDRILEVLKSRNGAMPYWDKTQPDIILAKFNISKAAFKRALGKLMKDGLIYQEEGWTYLKEKK